MTDPAMPAFSTNAAGVAIEGYDPVAYFSDHTARPGSPEHAVEWGGVTWHFTSHTNAATFEEEPDRYAPQFGGRCAFGASVGKDAEASPTSWRIVDGKLCLMKSGSVRTLSKLFTGKITKAIAADET